MNKVLYYANGFLLAVAIVLAIVVWKSFPFRDYYASDLEDWEIVSWNWGEPQRNATIDGKSLTINEIHYAKGIGMHAPTSIKIFTPPGYKRFVADVGISDEVQADAPSSVVFRVTGDGVVLYESPTIRTDMPAWRVDVNVEWTHELMLEATDAGDGTNSDHAVWGDARFVP